MSAKTYAILGTGALGGYYGARLHHAGCDVHFLLHSDYDHVVKRGLTVDSVDGDFSIAKPHVYRRVSDMPRCDFVIVALKTTQNGVLPDLLPHVMSDDGAAVVMQNGLGIEKEIAQIVGPDRVIGGLAFLCSNKIGPGHIRHLDYGQVRLGEYSADHQPRGITPRLRQLEADFTRAGLPVVLEEDLLLARCKKLVWNVPYNGLSVVLNATTDVLMGDPDSRRLCEQLMGEVVGAAAGFGRTIDDDFVQGMLSHTEKMVSYKPSMLLDFESGRPMEIEAIYGNLIRSAAEVGIDLPRIAMLYQQLKMLDRRTASRE